MTTLTDLLKFKLSALDRAGSIVVQDGTPTHQFQQNWQNQGKAIEGAIQILAEAVDGILAAQTAAEAANAAAVVAQDAAATAQVTAEAANDAAATAQVAAEAANDAAAAVGSEGTITASGTSGLTLTATDAGTDATVNISAHTRIYGDGSSVSVSAGSITGLAYSTDYWVFYDDPTRAGGSVTYQHSTDPADAVQTGDRHSVGAVTTPAAAAPDNNGKEVLPAGVVYP